MTSRILITGAGGFVGGHVVAAARGEAGIRLRLVQHLTAVDGDAAGMGTGTGQSDQAAEHEAVHETDHAPVHEVVHADLTDPASLRGLCSGVDAVVHCASLIGGSGPDARAVNEFGTRALVEEAERCGVGRIVYLSTASVYGRGPFTALRPGQAAPSPGSATSRTRAAAERHVLAAGGVVLRPHLVYGAGDRWVVPGLAALLRELGAPVATGGPGAARHSLIDVRTLGRVLLATALSPAVRPGVRHVNHPEPVDAAALQTAVIGALGLDCAGAAVSVENARTRLAASPRLVHHLEMLAVEHWFADEGIWDESGCAPGPDFAAAFPRYAPWYRGLMGQEQTGRA